MSTVYFCDMRAIVRLVLLMFVFFLSTPTIVSVIKKSCDTSCIFNMSEEELAHKEVKAELKCYFPYHLPVAVEETIQPVAAKPIDMVDSFSARILIPPPELV
ncbi:hypothetical protein HUK80_00850 [Flavobacterium sp. MAH-1]|uniref:Uncharacterized protein n=1 Tax=Flavobacterium agri TaxID=2743471 RepID=A0A7Y9C5R1_9FLAO|nr:hypothetical protein [Flavobacterium agri]NUY79427.1 hypothetical protein [Flavobacterium agri]NYA69452.1 hypothetical protein [Flavobacterium agri]